MIARVNHSSRIKTQDMKLRINTRILISINLHKNDIRTSPQSCDAMRRRKRPLPHMSWLFWLFWLFRLFWLSWSVSDDSFE